MTLVPSLHFLPLHSEVIPLPHHRPHAMSRQQLDCGDYTQITALYNGGYANISLKTFARGYMGNRHHGTERSLCCCQGNFIHKPLHVQPVLCRKAVRYLHIYCFIMINVGCIGKFKKDWAENSLSAVVLPRWDHALDAVFCVVEPVNVLHVVGLYAAVLCFCRTIHCSSKFDFALLLPL